MDLLPFSIKILMMINYHSRVYVCSIMDNFITHLLFISEEMVMDINSATCKMGDQKMLATSLRSNKKGGLNM